LLTGKELKLLRIKNDIKAVDVAKELKVTGAYISMMENGKKNIPEQVYRKWIKIINKK
jgi:transcriptional regulator with XRE-family HTH domain